MITEEQKQQLIDLNDSRVNEILEVGLKVGDWYKSSYISERIIFITKIVEVNDCAWNQYNQVYYYGIVDEEWRDEDYMANTSLEYSLVKATKQEVEQALTDEAKRRGLKNIGEIGINQVFKDDIRKKGTFCTADNTYSFYQEINTLYLDSVTIFKDGQWAEIIDDKAEIKQEMKELEVRLKELRKKL